MLVWCWVVGCVQAGPTAAISWRGEDHHLSRREWPWRGAGRKSVGGDTNQKHRRLIFDRCKTGKQEHNFWSRSCPHDSGGRHDRSIQKVCRSKYSGCRYEDGSIDASADCAAWDRDPRGKPHPGCASQYLSCGESYVRAWFVNVSNAAFSRSCRFWSDQWTSGWNSHPRVLCGPAHF